MGNLELLNEKGFEIQGIDIGRDSFFFIIWLSRTRQLCERLNMDFDINEEKVFEEYKNKWQLKFNYTPEMNQQEIEEMKISEMCAKSRAISEKRGDFFAHWYSDGDEIFVFFENDMENFIKLENEEKELLKTVVYEEYLKEYCDLVKK